ncbi:hypothetical protein [Mycolicibacterium porcinum]|uniref:hypothetical protein n=1 Tax=Mycolicibacterium porcinum TaxID=39693 RepID=UPI0013F4CFDB|nr:hypothetical protein [Mycolicibacterium porcinum]
MTAETPAMRWIERPFAAADLHAAVTVADDLDPCAADCYWLATGADGRVYLADADWC